jgi:hypothetical protein
MNIINPPEKVNEDFDNNQAIRNQVVNLIGVKRVFNIFYSQELKPNDFSKNDLSNHIRKDKEPMILNKLKKHSYVESSLNATKSFNLFKKKSVSTKCKETLIDNKQLTNKIKRKVSVPFN